MPIVSIPLEDLGRYIGRTLARPELEPLLDQLGCDVEDFTTLRRVQCAACGALTELSAREDPPSVCPDCGVGQETLDPLWTEVGEVDVVRMDALPIRPDLFDAGGLARAIKGLRGEATGAVRYELAPAVFHVEVDPGMAEPASYRPYIKCAVIRGLTLDDVTLRQVMKLQELLHWALGRDRKLASIGVYDLAALKPHVRYTSVDPDSFRFVPLQTRDGAAVSPRWILEEHPKGAAYAHLLAELERYPILIDEAGQVLSMPPIINSNETRLTLETEDVFIDVTGIAERAVDKALNTLVASMMELFPDAQAEQVALHHGDTTVLSPDFAPTSFGISVAHTERRIGVSFGRDQTKALLAKMRHDVRDDPDDEDRLIVDVPAYRNDIMHEVDLIEDVAIAYGYNNLPRGLVPSMTIAHERTERVVATRARVALTGLGYYETMSLMLTNEADHYGLLGLEPPGDAVVVAHPISVEQTMLRTSLLPGLLELFALNRGQGLPQRLCEVDDVVRILSGVEEPVEELHVVAGALGTHVGFADVKALAESLAREIGLSFRFVPSKHPAFLPGRAATLFSGDLELGVCGEIHPETLDRLRLVTPLVALEINLQPLVDGSLA